MELYNLYARVKDLNTEGDKLKFAMRVAKTAGLSNYYRFTKSIRFVIDNNLDFSEITPRGFVQRFGMGTLSFWYIDYYNNHLGKSAKKYS